MNRRTKSGCLITFADFWLDTLHCQGEPYQRISTERRNYQSIPLSRKEAKEYFFRSSAEFTDSATDYIEHLMGWPSRY